MSTQLQPQKKHVYMLVYVRGPESIFFEGEARAISSVNDRGPFDILPEHENFISLIKDKVIVYPRDGEKKVMEIDVGILKVQNNQLHIFLGIEALAPDLAEAFQSPLIPLQQPNPGQK